MAKLGGFELKSIKHFQSMEWGEDGGTSANVYLNGKKVGEYINYGDGGEGRIDYVSKDAEKQTELFLLDYASTKDYISPRFVDTPAEFEHSKEIYLKYHPYVPEEKVTERTLSNADIDLLVGDFEALLDCEKAFKKAEKMGHDKVGRVASTIYSFSKNMTEQEAQDDLIDNFNKITEKYPHLADMYGAPKLYTSMDDFNISYEKMMENSHQIGTLKDVVKFALEQGYFEVVNREDDFGCDGLHVLTSRNGFYAFGSEYEGYEKSGEEFVKEVGIEGVSQMISSTLEDMLEDDVYIDEAYGYLLDINFIYNKVSGFEKIQDTLTDTIKETRKAIEDMEQEVEK